MGGLSTGQLRAGFRAELQGFGARHDQDLDTIEGIWEKHERVYAFDESTGLATRRPFHEHLATSLLQAHKTPATGAVGVLFIDLNNLKRINDTCGHHVGDTALAAVGAIIREALRVDRGGDVVASARDDAYSIARHGGDEFAVALTLASATAIGHVAPRVKRSADDVELQRAHGYVGVPELTIAIGGVAYEAPRTAPGMTPGSMANALLAAADSLMYGSKRDGLVHVAFAHFTDKLEVHGEQLLPAHPVG